ncbi:MAG: hypothetical protein MUD01_15970 [Chloroflexaceae bacterium]|nr:hypothetical protein [Chloroflexaceae bacterium]
MDEVLSHLHTAETPGIVYVPKGRHARLLARFLRNSGVRALAYHKRLRAAKRKRVLASFHTAETHIIVAAAKLPNRKKLRQGRFEVFLNSEEELRGEN